MALAPELLSYLPVLGWGGVGLLLLVAYRRWPSLLVLRLAAVFLGLWAVIATTAAVTVVATGGFAGLLARLSSPLAFLKAPSPVLWAYGAAGAFGVFLVAFLVSQAVARGILHLAAVRSLAWPSRLAPPAARSSLYAFPSARADAFTFTLIERGTKTCFERREVVLVSEGLLARLSPDEWEAVVAHELGHVRGFDGRYLTFFRTLSRMMRWDPVVAVLANLLTRREEYRADLDAVARTRRPRALARALYKAGVAFDADGTRGAPSLLGVGRRRDTVERIRRLVALADSGAFPEERSE